MHFAEESVKRSIQARRDIKNGITHPRRKWQFRRSNCVCYQNEIGAVAAIMSDYNPVKYGRRWGVQNQTAQFIVEPEFSETEAQHLAKALSQNPDIDPDELYALIGRN